MSKIYKIHKWLSIVSVLFFLMFCITGLILMFRTELNAWAQGIYPLLWGLHIFYGIVLLILPQL